MAEAKGAFAQLLATTKVGQVLPADRQTVTMRVDQTLDEVVKAFGQHHIQSTPLLNGKGEVVGFLDVLDVLKFVVEVSPHPLELAKDDLTTLGETQQALKAKSAGDLMDASGKDPFVAARTEDPLASVTALFCRGVHRTAVLGKQLPSERRSSFSLSSAAARKSQVGAGALGLEMISTCSQSDVIRYIQRLVVTDEWALEPALRPLQADMIRTTKKKLTELGFKPVGDPVTVPRNATVRKALSLLWQRKVTSLGVVDPKTGYLVGNLSASDLLGLFKEEFPNMPRFQDTVEEFLLRYSPGALHPVVSTPTSTLGALLKAFVERKLHHVWVVDSRKPVAVITLTDLLRVIAAN